MAPVRNSECTATSTEMQAMVSTCMGVHRVFFVI